MLQYTQSDKISESKLDFVVLFWCIVREHFGPCGSKVYYFFFKVIYRIFMFGRLCPHQHINHSSGPFFFIGNSVYFWNSHCSDFVCGVTNPWTESKGLHMHSTDEK